ncbi:hypothetical protein LXG23DRAFT_47424 [Yarrowia lipolytica]|uniref:Uncharacterized protein n=1 Tax=Yarrowia lipolytica TaxID=4952 RepID=A0A1D8NPI1_YARLL|nr:hypothetical protein YALI1_F29127g [Yarrowia lipolytica]KAJ8055386.1 hypothetical protein LXG23DRAFT_47424 [Yarrowia lipolytica]
MFFSVQSAHPDCCLQFLLYWKDSCGQHALRRTHSLDRCALYLSGPCIQGNVNLPQRHSKKSIQMTMSSTTAVKTTEVPHFARLPGYGFLEKVVVHIIRNFLVHLCLNMELVHIVTEGSLQKIDELFPTYRKSVAMTRSLPSAQMTKLRRARPLGCPPPTHLLSIFKTRRRDALTDLPGMSFPRGVLTAL